MMHVIVSTPQGHKRANGIRAVLSGIPMGIGLSLLVVPTIDSLLGLNYAFMIIGAVSLVVGASKSADMNNFKVK